MRILHLGNLQTVPALRALGHDVRVASQLCPLLVAPGRPVDVRLLHREIAPDAEAFFMVDTLGLQTLAYGIEELPIPRLYWAIDVHLNFFWQRHYAGLFDLVLVAQKDYVPLFEAEGVPARWLPWGIDPGLFHDQRLARTTDLAFVGVIDANRPKRAAAVAELRRRFGLVTFGEDAAHRLAEPEMARVFGSAKIVFNESVMGDVEFRTFEAMACGGLLLTERTGNGLLDLFTPGKHLAVYEPDDLVDQVAHFLAVADYFLRSLAIEPNAPRIVEQLCAVLELAGRDEFARPFRAGQVLDAPADPEVRARFARVLKRSYQLTESEHQARVATVLAGDDGIAGTLAECGAAYREAGVALLHAGEAARAALLLEHAVALAPAVAEARTDAALAHLESGDLVAAERHLEHALAMSVADQPRLAALLALVQERVAVSARVDLVRKAG